MDDEIIYTNTGGFRFLFKMGKNERGTLYINSNKDSINFNYELKKTSRNFIGSKTKKLKKTIIYEYYIQYPDNKVNEYDILKEYRTLISFKKKSIFKYEPHNKPIFTTSKF